MFAPSVTSFVCAVESLTPAAKRRRCRRPSGEKPSPRPSPDDAPPPTTTAEYDAELVAYEERHHACQLTDGHYELALRRRQQQRDAATTQGGDAADQADTTWSSVIDTHHVSRSHGGRRRPLLEGEFGLCN